jgi:NADH-quinone oxidoreductase subunit E
VPRLNPDNVQRAQDLISLYPEPRSALIPILHVLQEQDGYLTEDGMTHVGEILGLEAVEVRGTASFYDMFHFEPVGKYLVAVCTNIACMLQGAYRLLEHAEETLGVASGGTTTDGLFTLEDAECLALCGNAPCVTVNWRFFGDVDQDGFDALMEDLRSGRLDDEVPPHGTLIRVRRTVGLAAGGPDAHDPGRGDGAGPGDGAGLGGGAGRPGGPDAAGAHAASSAGTGPGPTAAVVDLSTRRTTAATSVVDGAHLEGA